MVTKEEVIREGEGLVIHCCFGGVVVVVMHGVLYGVPCGEPLRGEPLNP